jgi:uncharacterized protein involved in outer membrane biogenesis
MWRRLLAAALLILVLAAIGLVLFARGIVGNDLLRQTLERQLSSRLGEPVRIASLGASFFPRVTVDLEEVTAGEPVTARIGEVSIATGLRGLLSRRVEEASVVVADGRIPVAFALGIAGAAAEPQAAPADETASGEGFRIVSVRTLAFRNVELVAEPHALTVDLESSLAGDRLDVSSLHAVSAGTVLDLNGSLTSIERRTGQFTARANQLVLDELMAIASGLAAAAPNPGSHDAATTTAKTAAGPLDVTVALSAPTGTAGGYTFSDLSATIHLTPGRVDLDPVELGLFAGTFGGKAGVNLQPVPPELELQGTLAGVDVARALTETRGSASISGTLGGTFSIASAGASADPLLRAAHGTATLAITNGTVPGLEMVRSIILAFGKPSGAPAAGSGSAFTRLGGTFALDRQVLTSKDLAFASRDYDMTGTTRVHLDSGALDAKVTVALSRELTAQAGTDLRRYTVQDGRIIMPAVLSGTVAAPKVTIDLADALNRALQNELKRRVGGWLDRVIRRD